MRPRLKPRPRPAPNKKSFFGQPLLFFFILLLGFLLVYALEGLPLVGDPASPASVHVSPRYIEQGALETGQTHLTAAVLSDYRGFDLLILSFLILAAGLATLSLGWGKSGGSRAPSAPGKALGAALLGPMFCLLIGLLCLAGGGNFLDYEALSLPVRPDQTRAAGSLLMESGILLSFLGFLFTGLRLFSQEGKVSRER
jgi:multicomponent Na+:H+ antiporter subunit B